MSNAKRTLIFCAGFYGKCIAKSILKKGGIIVGFIDNNVSIQGTEVKLYEDAVDTYKIYSLSEINGLKFDKIIIATDREESVKDIKKQLMDVIDFEKISVETVVDNMELRTDALAQDLVYNEYKNHRVAFIRDFARWVSEMDIEGNVAECGVWMGDMAFYINKYFPKKKCYLFDTFEGFNAGDVEKEFELNDSRFIEGRFSKGAHFQTEVDLVRVIEKKLPYIEKCIIKKGYFPETAEGLDDKFCFVNLDMDLYAPMYAALGFFYEKMSVNGVLLLHDYFLKELPGVRKAVSDFEKTLGKCLVKVPIGDNCSIAIIKTE